MLIYLIDKSFFAADRLIFLPDREFFPARREFLHRWRGGISAAAGSASRLDYSLRRRRTPPLAGAMPATY
jgi:hypothetical protein